MDFTQKDVHALAELARLQLSSEEEQRFQKNLADILTFVGRLSQIDTSSVAEADEQRSSEGYRTDESRVVEGGTRDAIIEAFPTKVGTLLSVPAVFDKPKG